MTAAGAVGGRQLDWLLVDFTRRTPGVRHGLVVSRDGLRLAASERIDTGLADQLAAISSGLVSLAQGAARAFSAEPVQQTIVEMGGGYLFVSSIGEGAVLAVFADRYCDIGMIGYEMTLLAARVGYVLNPAPRVGSGGAAP
ncbi:MAG TPA: roadblock/LC7 domain-containing protein [Actinomycetota bacterium]|nr:roadblock/LC7 domain-containing protein [Actinomycetota bacterium]